MAELADAADSKSADRKVVGVRPPLPAPNLNSYIFSDLQNGKNRSCLFFFCAQSVPKLSLTGITK